MAQLKHVLTDQNVAALVIAAIRLDEDARFDLIPENPANEYSKNFVIHKILQKAVIDYLSKEKKPFKYVRPDYLSSTFSDEMGWLTRSIISAVMDSVYSNISEN